MSDHQAGSSEAQTPMLDRVGKRKWGYNVAQVDEFLNNAHRLYEQQQPALTQEEVQLATFDLERGGYVMAQVDAVLIRLGRAVANKRTRWEIAQQGLPAWMKDTRALALTLQPRAEAQPGLRFKRAAHGKPAYDVAQVDSLVDVAWEQISREMDIDGAGSRSILNSVQSGERDKEGSAQKKTSASEVLNAIFTQRKGARGYDEASVNAYLNRVVQVLTRLESLDRLGMPVPTNGAAATSSFMPSSFDPGATSVLGDFSPNFAADVYDAPSNGMSLDEAQDMSETTVISPDLMSKAAHQADQKADQPNQKSAPTAVKSADSMAAFPPVDPFVARSNADNVASPSEETHQEAPQTPSVSAAPAESLPTFAPQEKNESSANEPAMSTDKNESAQQGQDSLPAFVPSFVTAAQEDHSAQSVTSGIASDDAASHDSEAKGAKDPMPRALQMMAPLMNSAQNRSESEGHSFAPRARHRRPAPTTPMTAPAAAPAATTPHTPAHAMGMSAQQNASTFAQPVSQRPVSQPSSSASTAAPARSISSFQPSQSAKPVEPAEPAVAMPPAVRAQKPVEPVIAPAPVEPELAATVTNAADKLPEVKEAVASALSSASSTAEQTESTFAVPQNSLAQNSLAQNLQGAAPAGNAQSEPGDDLKNGLKNNQDDQKDDQEASEQSQSADSRKSAAMSDADSYLNQLMNTNFTPTGSFDIPPLGFDNGK